MKQKTFSTVSTLTKTPNEIGFIHHSNISHSWYKTNKLFLKKRIPFNFATIRIESINTRWSLKNDAEWHFMDKYIFFLHKGIFWNFFSGVFHQMKCRVKYSHENLRDDLNHQKVWHFFLVWSHGLCRIREYSIPFFFSWFWKEFDQLECKWHFVFSTSLKKLLDVSSFFFSDCTMDKSTALKVETTRFHEWVVSVLEDMEEL